MQDDVTKAITEILCELGIESTAISDSVTLGDELGECGGVEPREVGVHAGTVHKRRAPRLWPGPVDGPPRTCGYALPVEV